MIAKTALSLIAQRAVLRQYATAHDAHSEQEQIDTYLGMDDDAQREHEAARITLRAYRNEIDDPEPEGLA